MPLYEYICKECGNSFDELRKSEDMDKEIVCTKCGSVKTVRKLSAFGVGGVNGNKTQCARKNQCGGG